MSENTKRILDEIRKKSKSKEIAFISSDNDIKIPGVVSTGSYSVDQAIGNGGLPLGRIVEIYGKESNGKTTLALSTIAQAQKQNLEVAFCDVEHAFDPDWAGVNGIDIDSLIVSQPNSGEEALNLVETMLLSGVKVIVVDSVSGLVPRAEIEGEIGDASIGLQARLMGQALRKLTPLVSKHEALLIFINQIREKIGVIYGPKETTSGGRALKFWASVRLDVSKKETIMDGKEAIGIRTRVKVVKNKVAPPFKEGEYDLLFASGIDQNQTILEKACELGWVNKSGTWYSGFDCKEQGHKKFIQALGNEKWHELTTYVMGNIKPEKEEKDESETVEWEG